MKMAFAVCVMEKNGACLQQNVAAEDPIQDAKMAVAQPCQKNPENVCLIIDLQGFFVRKAFLWRELGWRSYTGERGSTRYKLPYHFCQLSDKDKRTVAYITNRASCLPFDVRLTEHAISSDRAPDDVVALYKKYRTKTMNLIGYKGGHVEGLSEETGHFLSELRRICMSYIRTFDGVWLSSR